MRKHVVETIGTSFSSVDEDLWRHKIGSIHQAGEDGCDTSQHMLRHVHINRIENTMSSMNLFGMIFRHLWMFIGRRDIVSSA